MCFLPAAEQRRCQPAKSRADDRANHRHRAAERRAKGRTGQRGAGAPCAKPSSKAAGNAAVLVLGKPQCPAEQGIPERTEAPVHERGTEGKAARHERGLTAHRTRRGAAALHEQDFPRRVCSRRRQRGNRTRKSRPHDAGQTGSEGIGKQGGERDISDQPAYAAGLCRTGKHGFGGCAPERPLNACRHPHDDRVHHRNLEQLRDEAFEDAFERRQRKLAGFEEIFPHIQRSRLNAGKQACKGAFGLARRIRRFGLEFQNAAHGTVCPIVRRLERLEPFPLLYVLLRNLKPSKFLHLRGEDFRLELQGKPILPGQFLKLLVKLILVAREFGQTLLLLFLRLTQIKIALEPGLNLFLLLKLICLFCADALFIGVFCGLFVDLFQRLFIVGKDLCLLTRKDITGGRGELRLQGTD